MRKNLRRISYYPDATKPPFANKQGWSWDVTGKSNSLEAKTGPELYHFIASFLLKNDTKNRSKAKVASEFLSSAGIDCVKYPVDSYGKTVKDGDKVGWNYVSVRDDNIRVDHKWTDGEQMFNRAGMITAKNGDVFTVKSKDGVKKYKTPKEALDDFIKELDGVEMDAEQRGIYEVVAGTRNTADIRKNDHGELVKLHKGGRGKGAKKILSVHYAGKRGKVTAREVINMGLTIRFGRLDYDGTAEHPYSHTYTATTTDGVELKVVIDLDKKGNETIINFYSDRKTENGGQRPRPVSKTASPEIVSQDGDLAQGRFSIGGMVDQTASRQFKRVVREGEGGGQERQAACGVLWTRQGFGE